MRGIHIQFSNRFEPLADALVEALARPGGSPLDAPTVLVPSAAVRRRLTLEIARRLGVCANVRFDYLAAWLWARVVRHLGGTRMQSPFAVDPLSWRVYAALSDRAWVAAHARLARYVERGDETMRYELARRIAQVLEHYTTYRTDWLEAWQAGGWREPAGLSENARDDARWLAALWRRIADELEVRGTNPLSTWARDLADAGIESIPGLPGEIHVFGLPSIAPLHLRALQALGLRARVNLYVPNPCREYWFDVVDARRLAYLAARGRADHHEVGHRLLAAWGRQTQSQLQLLIDTLEAPVESAPFEMPADTGLLGTLQRSIVTLDDPEPGSIPLADDDRSLEIHVCHSTTRELEVLHDRLLALLRDAPELAPSDVLVVVPDIGTAAPLIDAVFGSVPPARRIPYAITGLAGSRSNEVAKALLDVLALARSRWKASEVYALLSRPPVAARFGLDGDALELVRDWIAQSGIRWGADAAHRAALGLPPTPGHSAADGLDRLFLGYALPEGTRSPFDGRLPAGDPQGSEARALGATWRFFESLHALQDAVSRERTAAGWALAIEDALHAFVAQDAREPEEHLRVLQSIRRIASQMPGTLADVTLPFELALLALRQSVDASTPGGVPSGAVTFASIHDLRGVPFEVVCMLGLNDRAFPSIDRPAEFDLMTALPRTGDRQRRLDDRNAFLDLLLAARRAVHLSYQGRGVRDNAVAPPSVVVSELLDWIVASVAGDASAVRARVVVEHPLQPFSRRCFGLVPGTDPRLLGFDAEFAAALAGREREAAAAAAARLRADADAGDVPPEHDAPAHDPPSHDPAEVEPVAPGPVFFASPLPPPGPEWHDVPLARLVSFFANPDRYLLEQRLGIAIERGIPVLEDDEPLLGDTRCSRALSARLLQPCIDGMPRETLDALARAGVEAPRGPVGEAWLASEIGRLQAFAARVAARLVGPVVAPHSVRLPIEVDGTPWTVHATFSTLREQGLVRWRYETVREEHRLNAWLHHLVLSASPAAGAAPAVAWIGRDATVAFRPVEAPREILAGLLRLYARGLREPLPFFPWSGWAFVGKGDDWAAARSRWAGSDFPRSPPPERELPAHRIALRGRPDPVLGESPEFADCARTVYAPLIAHLVS